MRLVRKRMQALSSRYGRVTLAVMQAGVIFMSHCNSTSGIVSFIVGNVPRVNNRLTEIGLCL